MTSRGATASAQVRAAGTEVCEGLRRAWTVTAPARDEIARSGRELWDRLAETSRELTSETREQLEQARVGERLERGKITVLHRIGLVHRTDLDELDRRLAELAERIGDLERGLAGAAPETSELSVRYQDGAWEIRRQGAPRAESTFPTKKEALGAAKAMAKRMQADRLIVCRKDGTVQDEIDYSG